MVNRVDVNFGRGGLALVACMFGLTACETLPDFDRFGTTRPAAQLEARPDPDARGVISYASYEVAIAVDGETVRMVATRLGLDADRTARLNGIHPDTPLRHGELVVLPDASRAGGVLTGQITGGPIRSPGSVDITAIAGAAIDQAEASAPQIRRDEPLRHRVTQGETANAIARRYKVSLRALIDWNGLGPDLSLRTGQVLLIPAPDLAVAPRVRPQIIDDGPKAIAIARPGQGSATPEPPAAAAPTPEPAAGPKDATAPETTTPADGGGVLSMPVQGSIIRDFEEGKSDGIDISAPAGSPVFAAADGSVAAITRDTDGVPILVLRHGDGLLTVYAGIDAITVERGDVVKRGQKIAVIRDTNPAFLHFETRRGFDAIDPMTLLN